MRKGEYSQAEKLLEASEVYPEQLGTGKPADPDYRVQDYLLMLCYQKSDSAAKATERKAAINAYATRSSKANWAILGDKLDAWYAESIRSRTR